MLKTVVVAGHICLDIIPDLSSMPAGEFKTVFEPGSLIEIGPAALSTGGPVSNTGLALHRLGVPTRLMAKIGQDHLGQIVLDLIKSYDPHLAEGMVSDASTSTSYSVIISPPGIDRIFLHSPGANHTFEAHDVDLNLVQNAALFHFGYPPVMRKMYKNGGQELCKLLLSVKETGATTSLDMCYPDPLSEGGKADWRAILRSVLPYVDIFLPSIEELFISLEPDLYHQLNRAGNLLENIDTDLLHQLSSELLEMGVKVAGIKLGERGLYLRTAGRNMLEGMGRAKPDSLSRWAERELWAPPFRVKVIGTTGSGDAAIAGFLAALLRGLYPEEAVTMANAVAACNVEAADALSGIRSWKDTRERIQSGWEQLPLSVTSPSWEWNDLWQLWQVI